MLIPCIDKDPIRLSCTTCFASEGSMFHLVACQIFHECDHLRNGKSRISGGVQGFLYKEGEILMHVHTHARTNTSMHHAAQVGDNSHAHHARISRIEGYQHTQALTHGDTHAVRTHAALIHATPTHAESSHTIHLHLILHEELHYIFPRHVIPSVCRLPHSSGYVFWPCVS